MSWRWSFLLLGLSSFLIPLGIILIGCFSPYWLQIFYSASTYYFIWALVLIWLFISLRTAFLCRSNLTSFFVSHRLALTVSFLVSALVFIYIPHNFKVFNDETVLLSMARSMSFDHRVDYVTEGMIKEGEFAPTQSMLEIRQLLFPFFIHLLHKTLGYNPENVFILNFLSLWMLLFFIYLLIRPYVSKFWAIGSIFLVFSQSIIPILSTSGTYEIFNLLFILLSLVNLRWFIGSKHPQVFQLLILNLIMLANIRYESIIFLFVILLFLLVYGYLKDKNLYGKWFVFMIPFIFLPWVMQKVLNLVIHQNLLAWEYRWGYRFHLYHIKRNLIDIKNTLFDVSGTLGFAGYLNMAGILAIIIGVFYYSRNFKNMDSQKRFFISLFFLLLLVHSCVFLLYGGSLRVDPMNGRYYLLEALLLSIAPACLLYNLSKRVKIIIYLGLFLILLCFQNGLNMARYDLFSQRNIIVKEHAFVKNFLKNRHEKTSLIIYVNAAQHIAFNQAGVMFNTANNKSKQILKDYTKGVYSNIYVIQQMSLIDSKPFNDSRLNPVFKLNQLIDQNMDYRYFLRISKVNQNI